jgi:hypothetical protein
MILITPQLFNLESTKEWQQIGKLIQYSNEQITMYITGGGGKVYMLMMFLELVLIAQMNNIKITAIITNEALSCHAFLATFADNIIFTPNSSLVFHHGYIKKSFLFGLIKYKSMNLSEYEMGIQNFLFKYCISSNILTQDDIDYMKKGGTVTVSEESGKRVKKYSNTLWNYLTK